MRQFISIEFKRGGRVYMYHHDGEPVKAGEHVSVATRFGNKIVTVIGVHDAAPSFETLPIIGKASLPEQVKSEEGI